MLEAVRAGAADPELADVEVRAIAALGATVGDVLWADGFVIGTPANIGYMSGAMKHFFDQVYYPTLEEKVGAAYAAYVHGNSDTVGAVRAIESITKGMGWRKVCEPLEVVGAIDKVVTDACYQLGATVAANLLAG